ncbi:MAG: efflux RND transporter periplasmic adaptor subunit [Halothiobacillus sp.]
MNKATLIGLVATGVVASVTASAVTYTLISASPIRTAVAEEMPGMDMSNGAASGLNGAKPAVTNQPATASVKTAAEPKLVTKYTCPMHPQIIEDHPGHCPICGMTLVPKLFPVGTRDTAGDTVEAAVSGAAQSSAPQVQTPAVVAPQPTQASSMAAVTPQFVTKYTCPMHPQIIENHPGHCPICGMTLVPKLFPVGTKDTAGDSAHSENPVTAQTNQSTAIPPLAAPINMPAVSVAPLTLRYMNVVLAPVQWRNLTRQIHSVGLVGFDENRLAHVHPRAGGWVEQLNVRALGDTVQKGQLLLTIYSPDILSAEKDFLVAQKSGMTELRDAARERLRLLNVPESIINQVAASGKVARTIPVLAPQSGYISAINLRDGMYVTPDLDMYTIADASKVWVQAEILARDMSQVAVGQPATMTVDGIPGRIWHGTVDFVYPELDPKSRTLKARLVFANPDGVLKPNQFAEVGISGVPQADVLTVPTSAVIPTPNGARVVRKNTDGSFQPVLVTVGQSADGYTQIERGLAPNDEVVASGQFLLDSESSLQASFERMTGGMGAQPAAAPEAASSPHQHTH